MDVLNGIERLAQSEERRATGASVADTALTRILDLSEDVPYNVQQLASQCWTMLREGVRRKLTPQTVDEALAIDDQLPSMIRPHSGTRRSVPARKEPPDVSL